MDKTLTQKRTLGRRDSWKVRRDGGYFFLFLASGRSSFVPMIGLRDCLIIFNKYLRIRSFSSSVIFPSIKSIKKSCSVAPIRFWSKWVWLSTLYWVFLCQYPMISPKNTYIATNATVNAHNGIEWKMGDLSSRSLYWITTNWAIVRKNIKYMPWPFLKSSQRLLNQLLSLSLNFPTIPEPFNIVVFVTFTLISSFVWLRHTKVP